MKEQNAYILGTDKEELHRLGLQHQVWASEAQKGWELAGFKAGQTLLDLGCGPGFCTKELALIAGASGKVIAVDKSEQFIDFLNGIKQQYNLNIDAIASDFDTMRLDTEGLDGAYCRWAMAWIPNPKEILEKVKKALRPEGKLVIHEYYDWSTHQLEPSSTVLDKAISACLQSFKDQDSEIDIGRKLPIMLDALGFKVTSTRLMPKLGRPDNLVWQWPKSFYYSYFPRLVNSGYLTKTEVSQAITDLKDLEKNVMTTLFCPMMIEVIAEKQ